MDFFETYNLRSLENLELLAKQVVEGFIIGLHKSPFHGFSVEFAEHRLYNQGESTKNIDWKVFARTDRLYTKKFEEETNLRCQIVIDSSSSMYFPDIKKTSTSYMNKIRFAALAAASLMQLLKKQRDAFGLSIFDHKIHTHTPAKSSTSHFRLMLTYLEQVLRDEVKDKTTSTSDALHQIADAIHKRSLVIIFSDMFEVEDRIDDMFSALQHLKHNKHEVILFHTVDKKLELDFDFENRPYEFIDMESGERVRLQSNQIKASYINKLKSFSKELKDKCLQYKIDLVEADISEGFIPILQNYLVKRAKMMT